MKLFFQTLFAKQLSFTYKVVYEAIFLKNSFTNEIEMYQTKPSSQLKAFRSQLIDFGSCQITLEYQLKLSTTLFNGRHGNRISCGKKDSGKQRNGTNRQHKQPRKS